MGRKGRDETLLASLARHPAASCCFLAAVLLLVTGLSFLGSILGVIYAIEGDATWRDLHSRLMRMPGAGTRGAAAGGAGAAGPGGGDELTGLGGVGGADLMLDVQLLQAAQPGRPEPYDVDGRTRRHWREITETICPNRDRRNCAAIDRSGWTDASRCAFGKLSFAGLGEWSTFKLTSHTSAGVRKTAGGDSWYIRLVDQSKEINLPTRIYDEGDGTYTVAVFFHKPGNYKVWAWLFYSDCHGYLEPVEDVDTIILDVTYFDRIPKEETCYIGQRLRYPPGVEYNIPEDEPLAQCMSMKCSAAAAAKNPDIKAKKFGDTWRMETYYMHEHGKFIPLPCCKPRLPVRKASMPPPERLLFCGDSTVFYSWMLLSYAIRKPCHFEIIDRLNQEALDDNNCKPLLPGETPAAMDAEFAAVMDRCTAGLPLTTVPIGADTQGSARISPWPLYYDMKNYKYVDTYAVNHVPPVPVPVPKEFSVIFLESGTLRTMLGMDETLKYTRENDVLIVNVGHHYTRLMRFEAWVKFVDELTEYLHKIKERTGAMLVMRTTFYLKENAVRSFNRTTLAWVEAPMLVNSYVPAALFNTDARRMLFDSYAEAKFASIGMHIWDVYGTTATAEYRMGDMFHAAGAPTWAQNVDMLDLFACNY